MAGNSSAANEMVANCSPVTEQLKMLVTKAKKLESEETILGKSMVAQINTLIATGKEVNSILSEAERVEINALPQLEGWLEQVYDAISEADDLLDECEHHRRHRGAFQRRTADTKEAKSKVQRYMNMKSIFSPLARPIASHVRHATTFFEWSDTISKFKSTNSNLANALASGREIHQSATALTGDGHVGQRSARLQAVEDVVAAESKVVLKDNSLGRIVGELLYSENDKDVSFVSLVGWFETGKEAFAREIYKNEEVMFHFDERMWLKSTTTIVDLFGLAKSMLAALTRTRVGPSKNPAKPDFGEGEVSVYHVDLSSSHKVQLPMKEIVNRRLKERLKGRRYLLVLDGVSQVEAPLKEFLEGLGGCKGCKVLTTAASAREGSSRVYYHEHKMVLETGGYCKALFESISFPRPSVFDEYPSDAYHIKILASLMCRMKDESQRNRIHEASANWKNPLNNDILKLCFGHMTSLPLKRCLQCCCLFPKGCLISREELIQLWMALGYLNLPSINDSEMVDLGSQYYDILHKCGFLQVSEEDDFDRQSSKVTEPLWKVIKLPGYEIVEKIQDAKKFSGAVHLLINCEVKLLKSLVSSFSKLRTLRLENCGGLGDIFDCTPGLRILIVVDESVEELPASIGKLIRLRYLDISRTRIGRLPHTLSELYHLQTLRLNGMLQVPSNFDNPTSLRHISVKNNHLPSANGFTSMFQEFGQVWYPNAKSSLSLVLDKDGNIDSLKWLKVPSTCLSISIHRLENATIEAVKEQTAVFVKKHGIEDLKLHWSAGRENSYDEDLVLENLVPNENVKSLEIENFKGTSFPSWMMNIGPKCLLHKLVKMELQNCSWCKELPACGSLRSLTILKIIRLDSVVMIGPEFYGTDATEIFPKLKVFILRDMQNLKEWHGLAGDKKAFPTLMSLEVEECPELTSIPKMDGMCLRKLRIAHNKKLASLAGSIESLVDLELFGLPALETFSVGTGSGLKILKIGCIKGPLNGSSAKLTNLTNLTIWGYDRLKTIPDWIVTFTSLQVLKVEFCATLENFPDPERMALLTNLTELNISNCPVLEDRFIRGSRAEWKKLRHISTIIVNNEKINPRIQKSNVQ